AGGEDQIMALCRGSNRACKRLRLVAQNTEVGDRAAKPPYQFVEQVTIGIVERGAGKRRPRFGNFVAGREQRNTHPPSDVQRGQSQGCSERDVRRAEPSSGAKRDRAGANVLAGKAPVGTALQARRHDDVITVETAVFLQKTVSAPGGIDGRGKRRTASPGLS